MASEWVKGSEWEGGDGGERGRERGRETSQPENAKLEE